MGKKFKNSINDNEGTGIPIEILMDPQKLDEYLLRKKGASSTETQNPAASKLVPSNYKKPNKEMLKTNTGAALAGIIDEKRRRDQQKQESDIRKADIAEKTCAGNCECHQPESEYNGFLWNPTVVSYPTRYGQGIRIGARTYPIIFAKDTQDYEIGNAEMSLGKILFMMVKTEEVPDVIYPQEEGYIDILEEIIGNVDVDKMIMLQDGNSIQLHVIDMEYVENKFVPDIMRVMSVNGGDYIETLMHIMNDYTHWPVILPIENIPKVFITKHMKEFENGIQQYYTMQDDDAEDKMRAFSAEAFSEFIRECIDVWKSNCEDDEYDGSVQSYLPTQTTGGASNDDDPFLGDSTGDMAADARVVAEEAAPVVSDPVCEGGPEPRTDTDNSVSDSGNKREDTNSTVAEGSGRSGASNRKPVPKKESVKEKVGTVGSGVDKTTVSEAVKEDDKKEEKEEVKKPAPKKAAAPPADDEEDMTVPVITVGKKKR